MKTLWLKIVGWFKAQGGFAHGIAAIYLALVGLYAAVPAFQQLVSTVYTATPSWAHQLFAAAIGIAAFYARTAKKGS